MDIRTGYQNQEVSHHGKHHHHKHHHGNESRDRQGYGADTVTLDEQRYDDADRKMQMMRREMSPAQAPASEAVNGAAPPAGDGGHTVNIGTFNVEWLGSEKAGGLKARSDKDYKDMASVIKASGADVLGLEEVGTPEALDRLITYLPGYDYVIGTTGVREGGKAQRIAILYDSNKVQVDKSSMEEIKEVMIPEIAGEGRLRAPVAVKMKSGNFDFTMVACHMKARFDEEAKEMRSAQAEKLNEWIDGKMKNGEKDIVVVGDFNDFLGSVPLRKMESRLYFVSQEAEARGEGSFIRRSSLIDQIGATSVQGGAMDNFIKGSVSLPDIRPYPNYIKRISDHRPIVASFRSDVDSE